jgi:type IV pilus assembly protein PilW
MKTFDNKSSLFHPNSVQAGFTLVEIMVGLAIGMLATMVIMQVFSVFESQKRTTTGASDAVTNGNISFYKIGRDIQAAGYALTPLGPNYSPLKCNAITVDPLISNAAALGVVTDIAPISILDGVSDTITIRYGSTDLGAVPTMINSLAGPVATLKSTLGCKTGDYTLAMSVNGCGISKAKDVSPSTSSTAASSAVKGTVTLYDASTAVGGGSLSCLGPLWHEVTYSVNTAKSQLLRQDTAFETKAGPSVADIVNIQAQYGVSIAAGVNQVSQWVDPTGMWAQGAMSVANRNRIQAVRFAVVARNAKMDVGYVTKACTTAKGVLNKGPCAWDDTNVDPAPLIDLSINYPNWQQYSYRVFETVIPLRNVVWAATTLVSP